MGDDVSGKKNKGWGYYASGSMLPHLSFSKPITMTRPASNGLIVGPVELGKPLASAERGAVMIPAGGLSASGGGVNVGSTEFDPDVVRAALLFFDRIDYPSNSMIQIGHECPEGLENWSGFQRSRVNLSGPLIPEVTSESVGEVFTSLEQREQGRWAVARGPTQSVLPVERLSPLAGFQIRLENALPVPDRSVSYDEVLSFKSRHSSELLALRGYLDELAVEVSNGGFSSFAQTVSFEKFDRALVDYAEVSRQANFLKRLFSVDISFSVSDAMKSILAGAAATTAGMTGLQSLGFAAAMGLSASVGLKRRSDSDKVSPFDYVFRAETEM
ncbi:DUF6236 family protein [Sphingorhabdus sp.]|jgi:hypothetical protein|uniref:DUF6236 family protein n=1 Tax=Sphingorhabdus sp. TaxID=1902408 RepID=UPI0037C80993